MIWYYLIIALQAFCIYHAIINRAPYYWIFVIFFLSGIGCAIYLITQVYNKRDAEKITSEITHIINPTRKIKDLEQQVAFADTYQNRVNLADALLANKDYQSAIQHYEKALEGNFQNDFYVIKNMIEAYHYMEDYKSVVSYGTQIQSHQEFKTSRTQFLYGFALEKAGDWEQAKHHLSAIDTRFSFYEERLIYANLLMVHGMMENARSILESLVTEGKQMTKVNKKMYRSTIDEAAKLLSTM